MYISMPMCTYRRESVGMCACWQFDVKDTTWFLVCKEFVCMCVYLCVCAHQHCQDNVSPHKDLDNSRPAWVVIRAKGTAKWVVRRKGSTSLQCCEQFSLATQGQATLNLCCNSIHIAGAPRISKDHAMTASM